eukprot:gene15493-18353_t
MIKTLRAETVRLRSVIEVTAEERSKSSVRSVEHDPLLEEATTCPLDQYMMGNTSNELSNDLGIDGTDSQPTSLAAHDLSETKPFDNPNPSTNRSLQGGAAWHAQQVHHFDGSYVDHRCPAATSAVYTSQAPEPSTSTVPSQAPAPVSRVMSSQAPTTSTVYPPAPGTWYMHNVQALSNRAAPAGSAMDPQAHLPRALEAGHTFCGPPAASPADVRLPPVRFSYDEQQAFHASATTGRGERSHLSALPLPHQIGCGGAMEATGLTEGAQNTPAHFRRPSIRPGEVVCLPVSTDEAQHPGQLPPSLTGSWVEEFEDDLGVYRGSEYVGPENPSWSQMMWMLDRQLVTQGQGVEGNGIDSQITYRHTQQEPEAACEGMLLRAFNIAAKFREKLDREGADLVTHAAVLCLCKQLLYDSMLDALGFNLLGNIVRALLVRTYRFIYVVQPSTEVLRVYWYWCGRYLNVLDLVSLVLVIYGVKARRTADTPYGIDLLFGALLCHMWTSLGLVVAFLHGGSHCGQRLLLFFKGKIPSVDFLCEQYDAPAFHNISALIESRAKYYARIWSLEGSNSSLTNISNIPTQELLDSSFNTPSRRALQGVFTLDCDEWQVPEAERSFFNTGQVVFEFLSVMVTIAFLLAYVKIAAKIVGLRRGQRTYDRILQDVKEVEQNTEKPDAVSLDTIGRQSWIEC